MKTADESTFELPPFPAIASKLMSELNRPNVEVPTVVELIECDPVITAKVLQLANSPMYGTTRPIVAISGSVVLLGFRTVAQLALAIASSKMFEAGDEDSREIRERVYTQSLGVAAVARACGQKFADVDIDQAFLAGIMHDVGKLALIQQHSQAYLKLLHTYGADEVCGAEQDAFGTTHAALGGYCAREWGMPPAIVEAIAHHHVQLDDAPTPLARTLVLANHLAEAWGIGFDATDLELPRELSEQFPEIVNEEFASECATQFEAIREVCQS